MDRTLDTLKTLEELGARNNAYTDAELDAARLEGASALRDAIERGETIFLMDEASPNRLQNAYALGWNSAWAQVHTKA